MSQQLSNLVGQFNQLQTPMLDPPPSQWYLLTIQIYFGQKYSSILITGNVIKTAAQHLNIKV